MRSLRQLPIRKKLTAFALISSGAAVLSALAACFAFEIFLARQTAARDMIALAQVIASNAAGPLVFKDADAAHELLAALSARPEIEQARLVDAAGHELASFRLSPRPDALIPRLRGQSCVVSGARIFVSQTVGHGGEILGSLILAANISGTLASLAFNAGIVFLVVLSIAMFVAYIFAERFQRIFTAPLLTLAGVAKQVAERKDYSLRVQNLAEDEIGSLAAAFNLMLAEVESRDRALQDAQEKLSAQFHALERESAERSRAQEETQALERRLEQTQRLESLGVLAGGIAHDFNNILAGIGGYTELLKYSLSRDPEMIENLDAIAAAASRAAHLVKQILTFSRQKDMQRTSLRLEVVVQEAMEFLRSTLPQSIEIRLSTDADTPPVLADATQIHQIVMNLGTNAWHAIGERSGKVELKLEPVDLDADLAAMRPGLRPGAYARLSVSDTGQGMAAETANRIFEPFFTTKPVGQGTGLGLAVVHGIMQSHGGAITVYSQLGEGTVFHLYFPADAVGKVPTPSRAAEIQLGRGERILYLDDEAPLSRLGKKMLERLGYIVEAYTEATVALAAIQANPAHFDLIITDQSMPGMTGIDFARTVSANHPKLPIILTTGYAGQITPDRLREAGVESLVLKPPSIPALAGAIRKALFARRNPIGTPGG